MFSLIFDRLKIAHNTYLLGTMTNIRLQQKNVFQIVLDAWSDMEVLNHRLKVIQKLIYTLHYLLCLAERAEACDVTFYISNLSPTI